MNDGLFVSNVRSGATGRAGDITINAGSVSLIDGTQLQSAVLGRQGNSGNITISTQGDVRISGVNSRNQLSSGIFSGTQTDVIGNAGNINITSQAGSIFLNNRATLTTENNGNGLAGKITLNTPNQISITDGVRVLATGDSGELFIGDLQSFSPALLRIEGANTQIGTDNNSTSSDKNAGSINISAAQIVINQAQLSSSTFGSGRAGNIFLQATGSFEMNDGNFFSNVISGATGRAGDITINAGSVSLIDGAQLQSSVLRGGQGNSGNITITSREDVRISGVSPRNQLPSAIFSNVVSNANSNAGNISITSQTGSIFLNDKALLQTTNSSDGFAGNIMLNARDQISVNQSSIISNGKQGSILIGKNDASSGTSSPRVVRLDGSTLSTKNGSVENSLDKEINAGDISIDATESISVANSSRITSSTERPGNAGSIRLRSENGNINLAYSDIFNTVEEGGIGNAGNINILARNLSLTDGSQIQTLVRQGQRGNAGNIIIKASDDVSFSGFSNTDRTGRQGFFPSGLRSDVNERAVGNGGNIDITSKNFSISNSAVIGANTFSSGNAGNIDITANTFSATEGGQINTNTFSSGNAGNITLNVADRITVSGKDSNNQISAILAITAENSTGRGGNIFIDPIEVRVTDGAFIAVASLGQGAGGNIQLFARRLILDNNGTITSETSTQDGGNITLFLEDILLLRRNSRVSASVASAGGDGGTITINSPLLVAVQSSDSNIIATAEEGRGGNIQLNNIAGIYNFQIGGSNDPNTNDISAGSRLGQSGTVQINNSAIDTTQGVITLPMEPNDPSKQIAAGCGETESEFVITGRGGLPSRPDEPLSQNTVWEDTGFVNVSNRQMAVENGNKIPESKPSRLSTQQVIPATGWIFNDKNEVQLVSHVPNATPEKLWSNSKSCPNN